MGSKRVLGRWLLYGVCLAPALIMLGYYALEYVPAQREYYVNLRFRALAVIGDQLRTKVEHLSTSLDYATKSTTPPAAEYIKALVPELTYRDQPCEPEAKASVEFGPSPDIVRFDARQGCAEASLSKILARFVSDDLFDDVILATDTGRVIYQRTSLSPKVVTLADLLKTSPDPKAISREGNGIDADAVRYVRLDDTEYLLLIQPVRISVGGAGQTSLMTCGLVRSQRLAEDSRHVPPLYLLVIFAPLAIIFLSGPFLKILLLTRTGRLAFRELALMCLCTLAAAGLITLLLVSWRQYSFSADQAEPELKRFADALNKQMRSDVEAMYRTLTDFDKVLPTNIGQLPAGQRDREDLLGSEFPLEKASRFDFVFWTNSKGCQVAKWTSKRFNTQRVNQTPEQHFKNVVARNFWLIGGNPKQQFTLQTLVSPTTSQLIVVMAIPSAHAGTLVAGCDSREPAGIVSAAMVAPLPSVSAPLVPPGAGYAIFEPGGLVLFHSTSERNLHENLFEEIRSPAALRAAAAMGATGSVSAYYRGRKYQFHIRPLTGLGGVPWNIAVFRELEPRQAMIGLVWGETITLFLVLLLVMVLSFLVLSLGLRARGLSWRCQIDVFLTFLWPNPALGHIYRTLAWQLAAIVVAAVVVVMIALRDPYRSAGWLLPFCFLMPLAAVALALFRVRKPDPSSWDEPPSGLGQPAYIAGLSLLLVLLAVVPTVGMFGVSQAFEARLQLMHWQQCLHGSVDARRQRLITAVEGSTAYTAKAKEFLRKKYRSDAGAVSAWDKQNYIAGFWESAMGRGIPRNPPTEQREWWQAFLTAIRPEAETNAVETGALARDVFNSGACIWDTEAGTPAHLVARCGIDSGAAMEIRSVLPAIGVPTEPWWWLIALSLLAGAYAWNSKAFGRLYMLDFHYTPLPALGDLGPTGAVQGHILLLGLPLARKDEAVRQWLGYTPARVNLYSTRFSANWLKQTTARLEQELTASSMTAQAAVAGSSVSSTRTAAAHPWVHISNLESKLGDPHDREVVANLLERLILMDVAGLRVRLIVTSAVDPVFHFDSVLSDERKKIYEHPLPEPELQRLARLLHNFRTVQMPSIAKQPAPAWAKDATGEMIYEECRYHPALLEVGEDVAARADAGQSRETLHLMIAERARALYKMFWFSCTRSEKLLLIQLAQTGLFNPLCTSTLEELIRKGLILPGPRPRLMNATFRRFLQSVEGPDTVREWESEAGESSWLIIRNVVLGLIIFGLLVVAMTQHQAMQTVTTVLTGVGAAVAGLLRLMGFLTGRRSTPDTSTQASDG